MIKTLKKVNIKGMHLNIVKATCYKPAANFMLNDKKKKKTESISSKMRERQDCPLSTFIQHSTESPSHSS